MACSNSAIELSICIGETEPTLKVSVIVATNIPKDIFVFMQTTDQDAGGCYLTEFCAVASCSQLTDFPADSPGVGNPFFRLDEVEKEFEDFGLLREFLDTLCADVDLLIDCWNKQVMFTDNKFILTFPRD